jgi:chitosanase
MLFLRGLITLVLPSQAETPTAPPSLLPNAATVLNSPLSHAEKLRAMRLTSIFESSKPDFDYGYIENLQDGRGYTAGPVGFCSGTGDMIKVIQRYTKVKSNNGLKKYIRALVKLTKRYDHGKKGADSVQELEGLVEAWKMAAADPDFQGSQDSLIDSLYFAPAMKYAETLGIRSPMGKAILYDSIVMHGDDPAYSDSIRVLITATQSAFCKLKERYSVGQTCPAPGGTLNLEQIISAFQTPLTHLVVVDQNCVPTSPSEENLWLSTFLDIRQEDIKNPKDHATQEEWSKNTIRTDILKQLLKDYHGEIPPAEANLDNYYYKGKLKPQSN